MTDLQTQTAKVTHAHHIELIIFCNLGAHLMKDGVVGTSTYSYGCERIVNQLLITGMHIFQVTKFKAFTIFFPDQIKNCLG